VVPVRDGARHVAAAVRSATGQSVASIEVLVVENGSTDETVDVVARLAADDARVRLLRSPAVGVSAARNVGIRAARSPWVAFLDADDVWRPDKLERQLASGGGDLRFADCRFVVDGTPTTVTFHRMSPPPSSTGGAAPELLAALVVGANPIALSTVLVARQHLVDAGGFDEGLQHAEDWQLWLRLLLAGASWSRLDAVVADYTVGPGAASRQLLAMVRGAVTALDSLAGPLATAGLGAAVAARRRHLEQTRIVLSRSATATWRQRGRDLAQLTRTGPSARSLAAQVVYTLAPRVLITRRGRDAARHDLPAQIRRLEGSAPT
jgi:hypothetical protein